MSLLTTEGGLINQIIALFGGRADDVSRRSAQVPRHPGGHHPVAGGGLGHHSAAFTVAAISNIDPQLYEASVIDGAGKWRQTVLHITLP